MSTPTPYTTLSLTEAARQQLEAQKREGESFSDTIVRLCNCEAGR